MTEEPTVLDYVKAILTPWRGAPPSIPPLQVETETPPLVSGDKETDFTLETTPETSDVASLGFFTRIKRSPWQLGVSFLFALAGQTAFEPPERHLPQGLFFYAIALFLFVWYFLRDKETLRSDDNPADTPTVETDSENIIDKPVIKPALLYKPNAAAIAGVLLLLAFVFFGNNQFTQYNLILWVAGVVITIFAFWQGRNKEFSSHPSWREVITNWLKRPQVTVTISKDFLLVLVIFALAFFFRFYQLDRVPPEMFSDHAEKLWDVYDVLHGETRIFFPRNTGREAFQMYLTAAVIRLFGTGYSFISLKIGTAILGFLALPYIYALAKELSNRRAAQFAVFFAGIAYWHNVISRVALRFTLYPFFAAPVLYYLIRGLRRRNLNDFILAGVFLGLGLHGYSTMRIVPFVIVFAVLLFLLHSQAKGWRREALSGLLLLAFISFTVFLPLLRYALENPDMFSYRAFTRLGAIERPLPAPLWQVFSSNLWKACIMFFWDNGEIWVHSVPHRPALDVVSAALFFLGVVLVLLRYLRTRDWTYLFLLISIPLLMLPSILSLAFPAENPSLNRTGGAIIPVFIIIGVTMDYILVGLSQRRNSPPPLSTLNPAVSKATMPLPVLVGVVVLLLWSTVQNYNLVFVKYYDMFLHSSWNTSELGKIIHGFADSIGSENQAWVIAYPHWVDTRLVGINAGFPQHDYGIWSDTLKSTTTETRIKIFLVKPDDEKGLQALVTLYPQGALQLYKSNVENKDFFIYTVPSDISISPSDDQ